MKRKPRRSPDHPSSQLPGSGRHGRKGPPGAPRTGQDHDGPREPGRKSRFRPDHGERPAPSWSGAAAKPSQTRPNQTRPTRPAPDRPAAERPQRREQPQPGPRGQVRGQAEGSRGGGGWIYGIHAALAVLANPARQVGRIVVAQEAIDELAPKIAGQAAARGTGLPPAEPLPREEIERLLPRAAVHQGLAVQASDVEPLDIDDLLRLIGDRPRVRLIALDQVTDPHNVGAILRSAAAFGAAAVILPERHAPGASAVMAKSASGAMERVPLVRVVNLARALDSLKAANVWCIGLVGSAPQSITEADLTGRVALVLGSEGEGLRRLTRERCDMLVRIPMADDGVESLNVSNAAAIALYEASRR